MANDDDDNGKVLDEYVDTNNSDDVNYSGRASEYTGIVLADQAMRITHANTAFTSITGYGLDECIGRNCNFLQGPQTNPTAVQTIRTCLKQCEPCRVALLNYRKDGRPFWNVLSIYPLLNRRGIVESYVGIQMVQPGEYIDNSLGILPWTPSAQSKDHTSTAPVLVRRRRSVKFIAETHLPTVHGVFLVRSFTMHDHANEQQDVTCICSGDIDGQSDVNVRVHDQCFTSEVLGSLKCDCKQQLDYAMAYMKANSGMIIYLPQEGRGMGLSAKIKAYSVQERGYDTVDANAVLGFDEDTRDYSCVPSILTYYDIKSIALLTNNPLKLQQLGGLGVDITQRIPIEVASNPHSEGYLKAKQARMGHMFNTS